MIDDHWTVEQYRAFLRTGVAPGNDYPAVSAADAKPARRFRRWTSEDVEILRDYYLKTKADDFLISDIAARLNRSREAIWHKASKLGVSDPKRKNRADDWPRKSAAVKRWRNSHDHRPFGGRRHTLEAKKKISDATSRNWADPKSHHNSEEYRQWLSDRFSKTAGLRRAYTRASGGRRADLNDQYFRSSWEANYARYLNFLVNKKVIFRWEYEADTFWFEEIKRGVRSYTPDFKVWRSDGAKPHYEEIKGWYDQNSHTKLERMRRYYPDIEIVLIDEQAYSNLARQVRKLIPNWERKLK